MEKKNKTPEYLLLIDSKNRGSILLPFYSPDPEVPTILTDEYLRTITKRARKNKFIALQELVYIMAADLQYTDSLQFIWVEYQCNGYTRGPAKPDISSVRSRIGVWQHLFHRWAFGVISGVRGGLGPIRYLPLYSWDEKKGCYQRYGVSTLSQGPEYVKLEELENYLNEIIEIPLPAILYLKHPTQPEQEAKTKEQEYPQEVIGLLKKAKNEIEDLYKGMMTTRQKPDEENGETYGDSLKYAAEEWFDKADDKYKIITKKHVTHFHLYFPNSKQEVPDIGHIPRDFKGKLCQVLISDTFPNKYISDLNRPSKGFGIKALYELLKSL